MESEYGSRGRREDGAALEEDDDEEEEEEEEEEEDMLGLLLLPLAPLVPVRVRERAAGEGEDAPSGDGPIAGPVLRAGTGWLLLLLNESRARVGSAGGAAGPVADPCCPSLAEPASRADVGGAADMAARRLTLGRRCERLKQR